jgi:hypothetical protein
VLHKAAVGGKKEGRKLIVIESNHNEEKLFKP